LQRKAPDRPNKYPRPSVVNHSETPNATFEVLDRATFSAWHGSSLDQGLSRPDVAPKASDVEGRLSDAIGRAACGFDKGVREDGVERARR